MVRTDAGCERHKAGIHPVGVIGVGLDETAPAAPDPDHLVAGLGRPAHHSLDAGVEPGDVAATGEDPDSHVLLRDKGHRRVVRADQHLRCCVVGSDGLRLEAHAWLCCRLPSAVCRLPSAVCCLLSADSVCRLPSADYHPPPVTVSGTVTTEPVSQATPVCYRHPNRLTRLSCASCGKPICVECSVDSAVGQKCPECAQPDGRYRVVEARRTWARPSTRSAPVTFTLIGISVTLFIVGLLLPTAADTLYLLFAQINSAVAKGEWWRLFTAAFLHAPTFFHVLFNMWALYAFGPQLERRVGGAAFATLYLSSAAAGAPPPIFLGNPATSGRARSGAIFGLFGVWLWNAFRARGTPVGTRPVDPVAWYCSGSMRSSASACRTSPGRGTSADWWRGS